MSIRERIAYQKAEMSVIGWSDSLEDAKRMANAIRLAPGCTSTEMFDRQENFEGVKRYT